MVRQDYIIESDGIHRTSPERLSASNEHRRRVRAKKKRARRRRNILMLILSLGSLGIIGFVAAQMLPVAFAGQSIEENVEITLGNGPIKDVSMFLKEDADASQASFVTDMSAIDYNTPGEQPVEILYKDNIYTSNLTITDTGKPEFISAEDFTTILGEPITYKSHVEVTDDSGKYDLAVDSSKAGAPM